MNTQREFSTISAIADTPIAAIEQFARFCNMLKKNRNMVLVGDKYEVVEQSPGTWACFALCEVDVVLDKSAELVASFH